MRAAVVAAERVGLDRVRVGIDRGAGPAMVGLRLRVDRPNRLLRWSVDASGAAVTGELEVTGLGRVAWVRARVTTDADGADGTVERDLADALARLKRLAEAGPHSEPEAGPHS